MLRMDDKLDLSHKTRPEYMPTYRLQPVDGARFNVTEVEALTMKVLTEKLSRIQYEPTRSNKLICEIANEIRDKLKKMKMRRYKYVVVVQLGSMDGQEVSIASRCVWADKTDNFATASFQNSYLFGVATVYGLYYE